MHDQPSLFERVMSRLNWTRLNKESRGDCSPAVLRHSAAALNIARMEVGRVPLFLQTCFKLSASYSVNSQTTHFWV